MSMTRLRILFSGPDDEAKISRHGRAYNAFIYVIEISNVI